MRDPVGEGVDVAVGPVGLRHLLSEPIDRDITFPLQETIEGHHQFGMGSGRDLAIIGNLANIP